MNHIPDAVEVINMEHYTLESLIGEGGFSKVFQARQKSTNQKVAIKLLKFHPSSDEEKRARQLARFDRETKLCAGIHHPNIVRLIDKGVSNEGNPFAVFEFVEGDTLKAFIEKHNGLSATLAGDLMGQVLDALTCAHDLGIVHRDLKPQNIIISKTGSKYHAKVLDFGVGTLIEDFQTQEYLELTLTQESVGTPSYCSPEQLRGEPPTTQTDLYAWGLVLTECLTGQPVMLGESVAEIYHKQLNGEKVPLPHEIKDHPIYPFLKKVLEKNPRNRPSDTRKLYTDFSLIQLSNLVGVIKPHTNVALGLVNEERTAENTVRFSTTINEKRQITVVCCKFMFRFEDIEHLDLETIDLVQSELLSVCTDYAERLGGYVAGSLGDNIMLYFGYPNVSDTDARKAGKTALELRKYFLENAHALAQKYGIHVDFQMGMNTGNVLSRPNAIPDGVTPNIALGLMNASSPGDILTTESTKKMLQSAFHFEASETLTLSTIPVPLKSFKLMESTDSLQNVLGHSQRKMVGRDHEFQNILDYWGHVKTNSGSSIFIEGQAGIGKSRLTNAFKTHLLKENEQIFELRCFPENQNNALYPFLEFLKTQLDIRNENSFISSLESLLKNAGCQLIDTMPIFCSWFYLTIPEGYHVSVKPPEDQKAILFAAIKQMLFWLTEKKNTVFLLEDFHWIDPTSIEFIQLFLKEIDEYNLLFYITSRPATHKSDAITFNRTIRLNCLSNDSTSALIRQILNADLDRQATDYILKQADGIPLFIEELTKMLLEDGHLFEKDSIYQLSPSIQNAEIPITLIDILNARLNQLGYGKETAQLAATIGREFNENLLLSASNLDRETLTSDLNLLLQSDLIVVGNSEQSYLFRHALIRDAAYQSMLKSQKEQNHLRIAESIESELSGMSEWEKNEESITTTGLLATHYEGAGSIKKAIGLWADAGEKSLKINACIESCEHLTHALELGKKYFYTDTVMEFELRSKLGQPLIAQFGWSSKEVEENAKRVFELADNTNVSLSLIEYWTQFTSALVLHDFKRSESIIQLFSKIGSNPFKDFLYEMMLATTDFYRGFHRSSIQRFEVIFKCLEENGEEFLENVTPEMIILPYMHQAWNYFLLNDEEQAHAYMAAGFKISEGDVFKILYSNAFYGIMCFYSIDNSMFESFVIKNYELGKQVGFNVLTVIGNLLMGQFNINKGLLKEGEKEMRENVDTLDEIRHRLFAGTYNLKLAETHIASDSHESMITKYLERGYTLVDTEYGHYFKAEYYRVKALYLRKCGKEKEAAQTKSDGLAYAERMVSECGGSTWFVERLKNI